MLRRVLVAALDKLLERLDPPTRCRVCGGDSAFAQTTDVDDADDLCLKHGGGGAAKERDR